MRPLRTCEKVPKNCSTPPVTGVLPEYLCVRPVTSPLRLRYPDWPMASLALETAARAAPEHPRGARAS